MFALAVGASIAVLSAFGLAQCAPDPQYAEACRLEGGTARSVPGTSLEGYCDHPDGYGSQAEVDACIWIFTERGWGIGACDYVRYEHNHWNAG
jgi:hypothetical protein